MHYIACYGDSLVQGFPFGTAYSWTAHVERLTQIKMLNYGLCGDCCDDIVYRMRQYALPEYVHQVLFLGGANDVLQGRRLEAIMYDYQRVIDFCAEKDYRLCIVLPFVSSDDLLNRRLLNLRQEVIMRCEGQAMLLDVQPAIGVDAKQRKNAYLDGLHPKASVYEAVGEYAAPLLKAWVKEKTE